MRLTTRLMQVASWLLVQRSVRDGEMTTTDARQDRYRLRDEPVEQIKSLEAEELPAGLIDLLQRSERLYGHVLHLDRRMYLEPEIVTQSRANPVLSQLQRLNAAFGTKE
jgi:regulator of CtrA degradation